MRRRLVIALDGLACLRDATASPDVDLAAAATLAELAGVDGVRLGVSEDLKPVREERFRAALAKARHELSRGEAREGPARVSALLDHLHAPAGADGTRRIERFAVRTRDRFVIVLAADVEWIGSAGNYAELHLAGATHLVRATMAELEAGLDPARFARIHRGTLLRLDRVREVIPATHGDYDVRLRDDTLLRMSRRYQGRVLG